MSTDNDLTITIISDETCADNDTSNIDDTGYTASDKSTMPDPRSISLEDRLLMVEKERDDVQERNLKLEQDKRDLLKRLEDAELRIQEEMDKVAKIFEVFERQVDEEEKLKRELGQHFQNLSASLDQSTTRLRESEETIHSLEESLRVLKIENQRKEDIHREDTAVYESLLARNKSTEEKLSHLERIVADDLIRLKVDTGAEGAAQRAIDPDIFDAISHYNERALMFEQRAIAFDEQEKALNERMTALQKASVTSEGTQELLAWKARCQKLEKSLTVVKSSRDSALQELQSLRDVCVCSSPPPSPRTPHPTVKAPLRLYVTPSSSGSGAEWDMDRKDSPVDVFKNALFGCVADDLAVDTAGAPLRQFPLSNHTDNGTTGRNEINGIPSE